MQGSKESVERLKELVAAGRVTLVYGAKEKAFNNAVALKEFLEKAASQGSREGGAW